MRLENLKSYLKWKKLQEEIDILKKDAEKLSSATLDIKDNKEHLAIFLNEEIKFCEQDLREEVKNWIKHYGGSEMICLDKLIRLKNLKNIDINQDISEAGLPSGISKTKKEKELQEMSEKIETLKKKQEKFIPEGQKGKGQPFTEEAYWIKRWTELAPLFWDICSVDGRYLNLEDEIDREIERMYFKLNLDKLPKIPFHKVLRINGEDYKVPLSHGNPAWEKSKSEQSFV